MGMLACARKSMNKAASGAFFDFCCGIALCGGPEVSGRGRSRLVLMGSRTHTDMHRYTMIYNRSLSFSRAVSLARCVVKSFGWQLYPSARIPRSSCCSSSPSLTLHSESAVYITAFLIPFLCAARFSLLQPSGGWLKRQLPATCR